MNDKNIWYAILFAFLVGAVLGAGIVYVVTFGTIADDQSRLTLYSISDRELRESNRLLDVENKRLTEAKGNFERRLDCFGLTVDELSKASEGLTGQGASFVKELRRIAGLIKEIAIQFETIRKP